MLKSSKKKKDEKLTFFKDTWKEVELLGVGSFGKVYKAKKDDFGVVSYCAIKRIEIPQTDAELHSLKTEGMTKEEITSYFEDTVKRWVDEIKVMSIFKDSPTIVNIEDYEVIEKPKKSGYIIHIRMELLQNIDDYVLKNNITDKDVLKMAIDMCSALEDCEKNDIVHRDIKPDNVFVNKKGVFKLGDFGIAKKVQGTLSNMSKKGTENYMAPELYKNEKGNKTVDIYSLGIMLYRYFNYNRLPFMPNYPDRITAQDRENALYQRIKGTKMPPPKNAKRDVAEIILKACNYYPKNRYQSASLLKKDLQKVYDEIKKETVIFDFNNKKMEKVIEKSQKSDVVEKQENVSDIANVEMNNNEKIVENVSVKEKKANNFIDKLKSKWKILLIIFLIILIIFGGIWLWPEEKEVEETLITMPLVVGQKSEVATNNLNKLGLVIEYEYVEVEDISQIGLVLEQSYKESEQIEKGTIIVLKIAVSKEKVAIISVIGLSREEAVEKLEEIGLQVNITEEYDKKVEKGFVVSQTPSEGEVYPGSVVELLVSLGEEKEKKESTSKSTNNENKNTSTKVKNWSGWVEVLPDGVSKNKYEIESKIQYRYRDKEMTTSTSASMDGWIKYDEQTTYSEWSSNKQSDNKITENDTTKIIKKDTYYKYYHYKTWYDGQWNADSIKVNSSSVYCEFATVWDMPAINFADKGGKQMVGSMDGCGDGVLGWFKFGSFIRYTYQTRTKIITYYFYKWNDWSNWSDDKVGSSDTREVETKTVYRYKEK